MFGIPLPLPPYEDVRSLLDDRRPTLQSALTAVVRTINSLLADASIRASIKSRVKTSESYYDKCLRRALDSGVETEQVTLTDLLGIRIVTPFMSEIDRVEALLESEFHVVEKQRKGDDLGFWEFGYESLHYLIACPELEGPNEGLEDDTVIEIQVRTLLQDAWAEV